MKKSIIIILFIIPFYVFPQNKEHNWSVDGYIKSLQMLWIPDNSKIWLNNNTIHNRIDFSWFPSYKWDIELGIRNRFIYGQLLQIYPEYSSLLEKDLGYFNWKKIIADDTSFALLSEIDRAKIQFTIGSFEIAVGRQRINWGIGLVWNPNDIFNTFSYFDFDYEKRPGSDGISMQYYTGATSIFQFVSSVDNDEKLTIASMFRFNKWSYDIQFLGGVMKNDMVIGGGWAGDIKGAGFRGEATYFLPLQNNEDTSAAFVASIDADYTFKNSLYLHFAALFNSLGTTKNAGFENIMLSPNISAKMLSPAKYSLFSQINFPFTPLFNIGLSAILNPSDGSSFISPLFSYSLNNNLELMSTAQNFIGKSKTEFGDYGKMFFLRLKWSF